MSRALKSMRVKMTRINILSLIMAGLMSSLSLTACAQPSTDEPITMEHSSLKNEILTVMNAVKEDWNTGRYDDFARHWDETDIQPIYLAEESDVMMTTWPEIKKYWAGTKAWNEWIIVCLLYTSPSPRDATLSRMPSSA